MQTMLKNVSLMRYFHYLHVCSSIAYDQMMFIHYALYIIQIPMTCLTFSIPTPPQQTLVSNRYFAGRPQEAAAGYGEWQRIDNANKITITYLKGQISCSVCQCINSLHIINCGIYFYFYKHRDLKKAKEISIRNIKETIQGHLNKNPKRTFQSRKALFLSRF